MTVREIVAEWLKNNGYDGLMSTWSGCACLIDDLAPCDYEHNSMENLNSIYCVAGKLVSIFGCNECKHRCISADVNPTCENAGIIKSSEGLI